MAPMQKVIRGTHAARQRTEDPGYSERMDALDEAVNDWALEAYARGEFAIDIPIEC